MQTNTNKKQGGSRPGAGRKKRNGETPVNTTVQVDKAVILLCRHKHGSLAAALRFAAINGPESVESERG